MRKSGLGEGQEESQETTYLLGEQNHGLLELPAECSREGVKSKGLSRLKVSLTYLESSPAGEANQGLHPLP